MAQLSGVATRHVLGNGGVDGEAVRVALTAHRDGEPLAEVLADAVGELRGVSTDRQLLSQAAGPYTADDETRPFRWYITRLLELAGADLDEARAWRITNPPRGFNPPQASPERDRKG